jgi:uncharacterized membrane protein YjgN (DUF898 family)
MTLSHTPEPSAVPPARATVSVPSIGTAPVQPSAWGGRGSRGAMPLGEGTTPFTWQGSPWSLAGACFINAALMILTIGIYGFWGRTEIRRRMWASVRFLGEPLAYHGTPQELLKGFFAVMAVVLVPLFVVGTFVVIVFGQASGEFVLYQSALFLGLYPILAAVAFYRARRYRLSRTSWRGVRGSITGSSGSYGFLSWATAWAYPFTLGWIAPYRAVALNSKIVKDTHLGDRVLTFDGSSSKLYGPFALLWFGTIVLYFIVLTVIGLVIGSKPSPGNPDWWRLLTAVCGRS